TVLIVRATLAGRGDVARAGEARPLAVEAAAGAAVGVAAARTGAIDARPARPVQAYRQEGAAGERRGALTLRVAGSAGDRLGARPRVTRAAAAVAVRGAAAARDRTCAHPADAVATEAVVRELARATSQRGAGPVEAAQAGATLVVVLARV